jgi:hypothetical protein
MHVADSAVSQNLNTFISVLLSYEIMLEKRRYFDKFKNSTEWFVKLVGTNKNFKQNFVGFMTQQAISQIGMIGGVNAVSSKYISQRLDAALTKSRIKKIARENTSHVKESNSRIYVFRVDEQLATQLQDSIKQAKSYLHFFSQLNDPKLRAENFKTQFYPYNLSTTPIVPDFFDLRKMEIDTLFGAVTSLVGYISFEEILFRKNSDRYYAVDKERYIYLIKRLGQLYDNVDDSIDQMNLELKKSELELQHAMTLSLRGKSN